MGILCPDRQGCLSKFTNYHCLTCLLLPFAHHPKFTWAYSYSVYPLSHFSFPLAQLCTAAPSSMPLAYRRTSWPWTLRRVNVVKNGAAESHLCHLVNVITSPCDDTEQSTRAGELPHLHRISVAVSISPSQFHTDTAGALLQHRPHEKGDAAFCLFAVSRPVPHSARCC